MKSFQSGAPSAAVQQLGWIDSLTALAGAPLVTPVNGDGKHDTFVSTLPPPPPALLLLRVPQKLTELVR